MSHYHNKYELGVSLVACSTLLWWDVALDNDTRCVKITNYVLSGASTWDVDASDIIGEIIRRHRADVAAEIMNELHERGLYLNPMEEL